jgi:hypothetical protein
MSCASETYSSTIVGSRMPACPAHYSSSVATPPLRRVQFPTTPATTSIADSTKTDPEYVWGDEGPIND